MAQVFVPVQRLDRGPRRIDFPDLAPGDVTFDDPLFGANLPPPPTSLPPGLGGSLPAAPTAPLDDAPISGAIPDGPAAPDPLGNGDTTTGGIAFITVSDASGRVLFRRPATGEEVEEAIRAADEAEREGQAAMDRIAAQRAELEALEGPSR